MGGGLWCEGYTCGTHNSIGPYNLDHPIASPSTVYIPLSAFPYLAPPPSSVLIHGSDLERTLRIVITSRLVTQSRFLHALEENLAPVMEQV